MPPTPPAGDGSSDASSAPTRPDAVYALGHTDQEHQRLLAQAEHSDWFTRVCLQQAGLRRGMRILDVGCGVGAVTQLLAELVGDSGEVVGMDRDLAALEKAEARLAAAGVRHASFVHGDPREHRFDQPFDGVVGRFVLMYMGDGGPALTRLVRHLKPGGLVWFQETDRTFPPQAVPPVPLVDQVNDWIVRTWMAAGAEVRMGTKLFPAMVAAGLPPPTLRMSTRIGGGTDFHGYRHFAEVVRSMLPLMLQYGVASPEEIGIHTLEERLRDAVVASGGVMVLPSHIAAWTRLSPG